MKAVVEESLRLLRQNEPHVLATVVRTRGMTPQKAGAKQLIRQDGSRVGTLGGGCVEGDIWYYAKEMLQDKSGPQFREYTLDADVVEKDGLVCGGTMFFYLEPQWQPRQALPFVEAITAAFEGGPPVAVATVVCSQNRSAPGTKCLIRENGQLTGSLGNATLDEQVRKVGQRLAPSGGTEVVRGPEGTEVYVEGFAAPPTLVIIGGGHIGKAVYNLARTLDFRIIVIDDRPEFASRTRFPQAERTVVAQFDQAFDTVALQYHSFIVVATRGHKFDDLATKAAVATPARYIGLLGSKRKNLMILRDLLDDDVPLERIKEVHAPVGLNIGAITPEEIAVSIVAEIVACMRGGDGRTMKIDERELYELAQNSE
ncbi:MAG: XdhC family protein [bacterium]